MILKILEMLVCMELSQCVQEFILFRNPIVMADSNKKT